MKRLFCAIAVIFALAYAGSAVIAQDSGSAGQITSPTPIFLPYGGTIVTEINLRDSDVLGIVKETIPAAANAVQEIAQQIESMGGASMPGDMGKMMSFASMIRTIDISQLVAAIDGLQAIRIVVAKYPQATDSEEFLRQFDSGVTKAGEFNKIITDSSKPYEAIGLYALPGNAGYMGFLYDRGQRTAYAWRTVGFVDVPKLVQWAGSVAKVAVPAFIPITPVAVPEPGDTDEIPDSDTQ